MIGTALGRVYRYDDAAQAYEQSLRAWDTLAAERPDHPVYLEELARVTSELGGFWSRRYYFTKGHAYLQRANALLAQLARDFPNYPVDPTVKLRIPDLLRATASARGEPPQAIRHNQPQYFWLLPHDAESLTRYDQEARELLLHWEQLTAAHPDVPDYQKAFHQAAMDYSRVLMAQDRFDECERLSTRQLVEINRLVAKYPDVPEYRVGQMWNEFELGQLQYLLGKHAEALEHYRTGIDAAGALTVQYPNEPRFLIHLGGMLIHCADPRFRDGERATQALRRALQITDNPAEWVNLGWAQTLAGHDDDAQSSYAHARKLGFIDARVHLGEAFLHVRQGRLDAARKSYALCTDWLNSTPNTIWYLPACRCLRTEFETLLREKEAAMSAGDSKEPMPMGESGHPRS